MNANKKLLKNRITTPVLNIINQAYEDLDKFKYLLNLMSLMHHNVSNESQNELGINKLVQFHEKRLGKQDYCFTTYRRYKVWERDLWRIYVHNDGGIKFEVPEDLNPDNIETAVKDYMNQINVELKSFKELYPEICEDKNV